MRTHEVIHKGCGKLIGWLHDNEMRLISSKFERLGGSRPLTGTTINEKCPHCDMKLIIPYSVRVNPI